MWTHDRDGCFSLPAEQHPENPPPPTVLSDGNGSLPHAAFGRDRHPSITVGFLWSIPSRLVLCTLEYQALSDRASRGLSLMSSFKSRQEKVRCDGVM